MGNSKTAGEAIVAAMKQQDRSFAWLARTARLPYKRVLAELKYGSRPLGLDTAIEAARVLGFTLSGILTEQDAA